MLGRVKPAACFIGTRLEALQAVMEHCEVVSIVTVTDSWVDQSCNEFGIAPYIVTKDTKEDVFRFISQQKASLVISAGFPFILPDYVLASGPKFINSHPSLLPDYRGYNAIRDAFKNGEERMGVTVHHMTSSVDYGETICQESVSVDGLSLSEIFNLLFGVVEPKAVSRSIEALLSCV